MRNFIKITLLSIVLFFGLSIFLLSNHIGGFRAFTVMSGSMEPAVSTGSLVITQKIHPSNLQKNDIITFIRPSKHREFITHRISELSTKENLTIIKTKGDNNKSEDSWVLAGGAVVGKSIITVPYLGYLLSFTKTKIGLALFILLPAFIIVYMEITNVINLLKSKKIKEIAIPERQLAVLLLALTFCIFSPFPQTSALLSDSASLTSNQFSVVLTPGSTDCGGDINIDVSGNGAGSTNTVNVTAECTSAVHQSNNTTIINTIQSNVTGQTNTSEIINQEGGEYYE